jgi:hypothetical protein
MIVGYDHRAAHGGWYPQAGTTNLDWYSSNPGWIPGAYGADPPANGAGAAGAGAGAPAGAPLTGTDIAALIASIGGVAVGVANTAVQADLANQLATQSGLTQQQAADNQNQLMSLLTLYSQGQQTQNQPAATTQQQQQGAMDQQAALDGLAAVLNQPEEKGMGGGAIAGIAIGATVLLGGIVFFATRAGRGNRYHY